MNLLPHSIRWRMQLWHGLLLALVLTAFGITAWQLAWTNERRQADVELQAQAHVLMGILHRERPHPRAQEGQPPPRRRPPPFEAAFSPLGAFDEQVDHPLDEAIENWINANGGGDRYYCLWGPNGELIDDMGSLAAQTTKPEWSDQSLLTPMAHERQVLINSVRQPVRELVEFTPPGEIVVIGRTLAAETARLQAMAWRLVGLGTSVWIIGFFGGGWLIKKALSPIQAISRTASQMSAGHLDQRINTDETDSELGQLARVLNDTFGRLEHAFEKQAQFTADAAHELRTPLSVLLSQTQLALTRERSPQEYRDTLETCQRSAKRMHALTESLLELAKLDAPTGTAKHQPLDLANVARDSIEQLQPLAEAHRIEFHAELSPTMVNGDAGQLAQVLTNVLSNALHHSPDGAVIEVTTRLGEGEAMASVTDHGPGIDAEHQARLFDRFYRAEASRNRHIGGAGLGLAICQTIAQSHGGRMTVTSEPGKGSNFTLHLPAGAEG